MNIFQFYKVASFWYEQPQQAWLLDYGNQDSALLLFTVLHQHLYIYLYQTVLIRAKVFRSDS